MQVSAVTRAAGPSMKGSYVSAPSGPQQPRRTTPTALFGKSNSEPATTTSADSVNKSSRVSISGTNVFQEVQLSMIGLGAAAVVAGSSIVHIPVADAASATSAGNMVVSELATLTTGMGGKGDGGKDAEAILRYALPINNKPIREAQNELEEITDKLKVPGAKYDPVISSARKAEKVLETKKDAIIAGVKDGQADAAGVKLNEIDGDIDNLIALVEKKEARKEASLDDKDLIRNTTRAVLRKIGDVEEMMVGEFPYEVPSEYANLPQLKGRAVVELKLKLNTKGRVITGMAGNTSTSFYLRSQEGRGATGSGGNPEEADVFEPVIRIICDGYSAPVTAGNFVDLVKRGFYNNMPIQRADDFVVQTGDPEGSAVGFVDPGTGKLRKIPLEILRRGDKVPIYSATFEDLGLTLDKPVLPFNAFGTVALAREQFDVDSGSSQFFFLLKESELTPTGLNLLDGSYGVFGYAVEGSEYLRDLKPGDLIQSATVVEGAEHLVVKNGSSNGAKPALQLATTATTAATEASS